MPSQPRHGSSQGRLALLACFAVPACGSPVAGADDSTGLQSSSDDGMVAQLCVDPVPLDFGDADWAKVPFQPPGGGGVPADPGDGGDSGASFIAEPDGGTVNSECDVWAMDCPDGEKCMPWANDGGGEWNATRCSPLASDPAAPGEACTVEGTPYSGLDDCGATSMCWEAAEDLSGSCIAFCSGNEANPACAPETWCYIGNGGTVHVCLPNSLCAADKVCHCMCPSDPDCIEGESCVPSEEESEMLAEIRRRRDAPQREVDSCPDSTDPLVLYMSNDDSNSQASPVLARRTIQGGGTVRPDAVRIHEFLNYYEIGDEAPGDTGARLALQMRRTAADSGEFTLAVQAIGRGMTTEDRPPLNLVFSLDTSGSMSGEPVARLQDTIRAAAGSLREGDVISIVTWSTQQSVPLDGLVVTGPDDPTLLAVVDGLTTGGSTDLAAGLVRAYQLAHDHHIAGGINRVFLVSDGGANAGVTDIDLIASEANDGDDDGTYLIGVGVGTGAGYHDHLMDTVTDAGRGAYVSIDSTEEAERMFGAHFLANVAVSARDVRFQLTLPWYFGIKQFHGEEYSEIPSEVEPQHLAPNDTMTSHQIIAACDPDVITTCDEIRARVDYIDPITGLPAHDEVSTTVADVVVQGSTSLRKADLVVGYAKALIVIGTLLDQGETEQAHETAVGMAAWAEQAAVALGGDADAIEIAETMGVYAASL